MRLSLKASEARVAEDLLEKEHVPAVAGAHVPRVSEGRRWYVVYTHPHREARAATQLAAQGFQTFLPRYRKTIRHARKLVTVSAPFFPRYLFVALDLKRDLWRSVNGTFGVVSVIMGEKLPCPIPDGIVDQLIASSDQDGQLMLDHNLKIGESVRLLTGPFASLVGELARIDGTRRVRVLLHLLGGAVTVSVGRGDLIPVRAA